MEEILNLAYESYRNSLIDIIEKGSNDSQIESEEIKIISDVIIQELNKEIKDIGIAQKLTSSSQDLTNKFFYSQDESLYWIKPLITELYIKLGIQKENDPELRKILITNKRFGRNNDYSVVTDITSNCKSHISSEIDVTNKFDFYLMPSDAKFDIASLSLFGHEVGHVYTTEHNFQLADVVGDITFENENIEYDSYDEFRVAFNKYLKDNKIKEVSNLDKTIEDFQKKPKIEPLSPRIIRKTEEYICDEIGRLLLGPAFDFALIKSLYSSEYEQMLTGSNLYPPPYLRVLYSLDNLKLFIKNYSGSKIGEKVKIIYEKYFIKDKILKNKIDKYYLLKSEQNNTIEYYALKAFETYKEKYLTENEKIIKFEFEKVEAQWDIVKKELDNMRPPFENVSDETPELISPITSLINSTLYYYSEEYKSGSNNFYEHSKTRESEIIIRNKIIEHIRYTISLYDFLKGIKRKINDELLDKQERGKVEKEIILNETVWKFRNRDVKNNFVVVPTTDINYQYNSNSVDLRLGNIFITQKLNNHADLPIMPNSNNLSVFYDKSYKRFGGEFTIHPHSFILAQTLEYICVPTDFYGMILGRSSWGRIGLTIATAVAVGPGFKGCITLELRNLGETPIKLKIGSRICQFVLINNPVPENKSDYSLSQSKYICPVSTEIPNLSGDRDWKILP